MSSNTSTPISSCHLYRTPTGPAWFRVSPNSPAPPEKREARIRTSPSSSTVHSVVLVAPAAAILVRDPCIPVRRRPMASTFRASLRPMVYLGNAMGLFKAAVMISDSCETPRLWKRSNNTQESATGRSSSSATSAISALVSVNAALKVRGRHQDFLFLLKYTVFLRHQPFERRESLQ